MLVRHAVVLVALLIGVVPPISAQDSAETKPDPDQIRRAAFYEAKPLIDEWIQLETADDHEQGAQKFREVADRLAEELEGHDDQLVSLLRGLAGSCERKLEAFDAATDALQEVLRIQEQRFGTDHWQTGDARRALTDLRLRQELTPEQRALLKRADSFGSRALNLFRQDRFNDALPLASESAAIQKRLLGTDHPDYANSLNNLALLYTAMGDSAQAEPLYQQALEIKERVLGTDHPDYATSLNNLATLYDSMGDDARAEPLMRQALEIRERVLGADHPRYATSLNSLAVLYHRMGDFAQAEPLYQQALEIRQRVLGTDHPDYATSLHNLAGVYKNMGDYAKAEPRYQQALEIRRRVLGTDHPHYATSLNNLARLYKAMGDYARAEPLYQQALEIRQRVLGTDHPDYAANLHNLAALYQSQGNFAQAEPLYRQALEIRERVLGTDHPSYATSLNNLAALYGAMGAYARAEPLYRQALEINKKVLGTEHPSYASSLNNLAALYQAMGDFANAEPLMRQALEINRKVLGTDHPSYATSLHNLALLHESMGDSANAEPLYQQALEIRERVLGTDHPDYAANLHNLAALYQSQGNFAQAEPLMRQALEIYERVLGTDHPDYATSLNNLALLYNNMGDSAKAEPLYRQALEIRERALGTDHPDYATSLNNLAGLYKGMGDSAQAVPLAEQATAIIRRQLEATSLVQSERQQLAMLKENRVFLDNLLDVSLSADLPAAETWNEVVVWKGSVFVRQQALRELREQDDPALTALLDELTDVARRRSTLLFQTPTPEQAAARRDQLATLAERQEQLEAELLRESATFRTGQEAATVTAAGLQTLLPRGSVLVDFLESSGRLLAFVVTADEVERVELGALQDLTPLIDTWRTEILNGQGTDSDAAHALRDRLWEPLAPHLGEAQTVLLAPDGVLTSLPFAALPGSEPGRYLLEEVTLTTLPFPQMLKLWQDQERAQASESLLLVGDVDFDAQPAVPTPDDQSPLLVQSRGLRAVTGNAQVVFPPLPGTKREIAFLDGLHSTLFPEAVRTTLAASQATEAALREQVRGQEVVHLATHGFFAPPDVLSLARSTEQETEPPRIQSPDEDHRNKFQGHPPGVLSGVVLAGANRPLEIDDLGADDGILTAAEVQELPLRSTNLVVLSACETGLGQVAGGEGVLGLQRAFHMAGARNVVTSLWQVDDAGTAALMSLFYRNLWEHDQSPSTALRNAQLSLLKHPEQIEALVTQRGLKFEAAVTIVEQPVTPERQAKKTPIHLWAAFTHSGPVGEE
ncbi:Nephrocystin-3 [Durusdinium trenchii]|uniref:Nephrocystin-3 n=1 Tax=Durusdinium trenchii TaxID=1381693 RepID=A0ABP0RJP1_9DINO